MHKPSSLLFSGSLPLRTPPFSGPLLFLGLSFFLAPPFLGPFSQLCSVYLYLSLTCSPFSGPFFSCIPCCGSLFCPFPLRAARPTDRPTVRPTDPPTDRPTDQPTNRREIKIHTDQLGERSSQREGTEQRATTRNTRKEGPRRGIACQ